MAISTHDVILVLTCNSISLAACFSLFRCYCFIPKRTIGLKMILCLSLADSLLHLSRITLYALLPFIELGPDGIPDNEQTKIALFVIAFLEVFCFRFTIFWGCNMAFFLYRLLSMKEMIHPQTYFKWSLTLITITSGILALLNMILLNNRFRALAPLLLSLVLTVLFYCMSIFTLRSQPEMVQILTKIKVIHLYVYAFLPFVIFAPSILDLLVGESIPWLNRVQMVLVGLMGFLNSMIYFHQRRRSSDKKRISIQHVENFVEDKKIRDSIPASFRPDISRYSSSSTVYY